MLRRPIIALFALVLVLGGCSHTDTFTCQISSQINVVPGSSEDLIKHVGDRVFFETDQSTLNREAHIMLDRQAAWLQHYNNVHLTIEGHADERGTRGYNLALGERRANAARNYLIGKGVAASRLNIISYGKERPDVVGSNEEVWSQNRRVVSVVQ